MQLSMNSINTMETGSRVELAKTHVFIAINPTIKWLKPNSRCYFSGVRLARMLDDALDNCQQTIEPEGLQA